MPRAVTYLSTVAQHWWVSVNPYMTQGLTGCLGRGRRLHRRISDPAPARGRRRQGRQTWSLLSVFSCRLAAVRFSTEVRLPSRRYIMVGKGREMGGRFGLGEEGRRVIRGKGAVAGRPKGERGTGMRDGGRRRRGSTRE